MRADTRCRAMDFTAMPNFAKPSAIASVFNASPIYFSIPARTGSAVPAGAKTPIQLCTTTSW